MGQIAEDMEISKKDIVRFDEPEIDFGDFLIFELADAVKNIHDVIHMGCLPTVKLGTVTLTINEQDVGQDARARLSNIVELIRYVINAEPNLEIADVVVPILELDGWSVTRKTLRTPIWLRDINEWPLPVVGGWYEELKCLETYTSL